MNDLTKREQDFFKRFLGYNGCGATTPQELLNDNFSCQCLEELYDLYNDMTSHEIGGFLSSLQTKGYIYLEDRDGAVCESKNKIKQMNFEPDLYWVSDEILENLSQDMTF